MSHPPKRPGPPRHDAHEPWLPGDPIPAPDATERSTDTSWALFSELRATDDMRYADTVPLTQAGIAAAPLPRPGGARLKLLPRVLGTAATVDAVLMLSRQNGRVCPMPLKWQEMFELLQARRAAPPAPGPMPVLDPAAWVRTSDLAKRMCLRDHLEWAATHGCLDEVQRFLKGLREEEWHHTRA